MERAAASLPWQRDWFVAGRARGRRDNRRQRRHGGVLEDSRHRQFNAQACADRSDDPSGEEGVATQLEEVIPRSDLLHPEDGAPNIENRSLLVGGRILPILGDPDCRSGRWAGGWGGEAGAVNLVVGSGGEGVERDVG